MDNEDLMDDELNWQIEQIALREQKFENSRNESVEFINNVILEQLGEFEENLVIDYKTEEIYDPYFAGLILLFKVNQYKGWSKEDLLKILIDVDYDENEED